jgi:hypothetical protein
MQRYVLLAGAMVGLLPAVLTGAPALAITAKQKMETCKFGADDQKLTGAARVVFLKKCMSNKNDPRGPAIRTPAAAGAPTPPNEEPEPKD